MVGVHSTKDRIFLSAIDMFAQKGYARATMKDIAEHMGIQSPSIYNHYKSKKEILDEILGYYTANYIEYRSSTAEVLKACDGPTEDLIRMLFFYWKGVEHFAFMLKISKIVIASRFENEEVKAVYQDCFFTEPMTYLQEAFGAMLREGKIVNLDCEALAYQIVAFTNMLFEEVLVKAWSPTEIRERFDQGVALLAVLWEGIRIPDAKATAIR